MVIAWFFISVETNFCILDDRSMTGRSTGRPETKKLRLRKELTSYITFSNMIVFEKGFFFNRRGGHIHSSILKFRLVFKGSPNAVTKM